MTSYKPRNQLQVALDDGLGKEHRRNPYLRILGGAVYFLIMWVIVSCVLSLIFIQIPSSIPPIKYFLNDCSKIPSVSYDLIVQSSESCVLKGWVGNLLGLASISLTAYGLMLPENPDQVNKHRD